MTWSKSWKTSKRLARRKGDALHMLSNERQLMAAVNHQSAITQMANADTRLKMVNLELDEVPVIRKQ